jgi:hypothetical protein
VWEHNDRAATRRPRAAGWRAADGAESPARSDAAGNWRLVLPHAGTFELVGGRIDHGNSPIARVDVSDANPHPTVELRLSAPAAICGMLVHADGAPFGGGSVRIEAEGDDGARDRFGPGPRPTSTSRAGSRSWACIRGRPTA